MRYSEFKPYKRLFEFAAPEGKEDIVSDLESILNTVDPSTPEYLEAIDLLQQIVTAGSTESEPVEQEPVEPQPAEQEPMVAQEPPAEELVEPDVAPVTCSLILGCDTSPRVKATLHHPIGLRVSTLLDSFFFILIIVLGISPSSPSRPEAS